MAGLNPDPFSSHQKLTADLLEMMVVSLKYMPLELGEGRGELQNWSSLGHKTSTASSMYIMASSRGNLDDVLTFYSLPSTGLVDKPQDTRFYDYILVDPKDEPYASFLFHYRSWEHLQSLQLIPPSHPRSLLKPSNSFAFLAGSSRDEGLLEGDKVEQMDSDNIDESSILLLDSPRFAHISQLRDSREFSLMRSNPKHLGGYEEAFKSNFLSIEERESQSVIPVSAFSVSQAKLDEWIYDRPLPKLPKAKSSFDHSRKSSSSSNAPSITPSLLPWCDRNSDNPSPEPIIGVAAVVPVFRSLSIPDDSALKVGFSCSSAECSLQASYQPSQSIRLTSNPLACLKADFLPPKVISKKLESENSPSICTQELLITQDSDNEENDPKDQFGGTSPPSEAEWISGEYSSLVKIEGSAQCRLVTMKMKDMTDPSTQLRNQRKALGIDRNPNRQIDESEDDYYCTHNWI